MQRRNCKRKDCEFHSYSDTGANICTILEKLPDGNQHMPARVCPFSNHPEVVKEKEPELIPLEKAPLIEWSTMMEWLHKVKVGEKL